MKEYFNRKKFEVIREIKLVESSTRVGTRIRKRY